MKATVDLRSRPAPKPEPVRCYCGGIGEPLDPAAKPPDNFPFPRMMYAHRGWFRCDRCKRIFGPPEKLRHPVGFPPIGAPVGDINPPAASTEPAADSDDDVDGRIVAGLEGLI